MHLTVAKTPAVWGLANTSLPGMVSRRKNWHRSQAIQAILKSRDGDPRGVVLSGWHLLGP